MSRLLLIIAIPLGIILLALLLIPAFVDEQRVLTLAQDAIKQQTGATLEVKGEVKFSLFPTIAVTLGDAAVTLPEEDAPTATAELLSIGVQLLPLLSKQVEMERILVQGLNATVQQASAPNTEGLPDPTAMTPEQRKAYEAAQQDAADAAAEQVQMLAAPLALTIDELSVTDSGIQLVSPEGDITTLRVEQLQLTDVNTAGRPVTLEAVVSAATSAEAPPVEATANGALVVDADSRQITLSDLALTIDGIIAETVELTFNGDADLNALVAQLQLAFVVGESRGDGTVRYASLESPQLDATLTMNLLNDALLALAGSDAGEEDASAETETNASDGDQPLPLEAIRGLSTRFDLNVEKGIYGNYEVDNLRLRGQAINGVAEVTELSGELFGGELGMTLSLDATNDNARLTTKGAVDGVDIAALLSAAEVEANVSGSATLDWNIQGTGRSSNQLVNNLAGPANLKTDAVVLEDVGIERMFCDAVSLVNQESMTETLPERSELKDLSAQIVFADGFAKLAPLNIDTYAARMRGTGRLALLKQNFDATFDTRLLPELGELDPACRVNERLTDIEWPVSCEGNLASDDAADWCSVDTQSIIEDLAKNEVRRKVEKEAGKLLDKLFKND